MDSINLTQVTIFVVAVCLASFFVTADDALVQLTKDNRVVHTKQLASVEVIEKAKESNDKLTFTSLDTDKNGELSQPEVAVGKNEWLVKSFTQMDSNADKSLSEQEVVDFVAKRAASTTK